MTTKIKVIRHKIIYCFLKNKMLEISAYSIFPSMIKESSTADKYPNVGS